MSHPISIPQRNLGPFQVSALAFGCMNVCHAYGASPTTEAAVRLLQEALDAGVTHFDTAALYGFGESERLVGRALKSRRDQFVLASKGGMAGVTGEDGVTRRVIDGRPEAVRRNCEDSLRRLGLDVIDLYYLHRWDKSVPIEDTVGEMSRLVERGHVRTVGLSEVSAATLRKAHAVHPIAALQTEYSLWTRNPEIAVLDACRELGVAFVAFSPLGRGFLSGKIGGAEVAAFDAKDIRRSMPRFTAEHYAANEKLLPAYQALAREAGCTPAQLALAWLLQKSEHIIPLFGTTSLDHTLENLGAAQVKLSADLVARLEDLINQKTVMGGRYNEQNNREVDTEVF
ncbi:aldo/keto reductase [Hylemonella gracilis ATCC 19624]|uniref:Aldo/keto reductase n=1 Tax=Hylemonella gracilis ATCC 19624 TaxID=887062 RepID=F3KVJ8_9BURK|nr:aldo/keto reductase [Hylemonella gracilis ATCC 19624]